MNTIFKKSLLSILVIFVSIMAFGQATLPSCVITAPHNNAYFMENMDITINVYSSDLGGTQTGGSITKVEFFSDDTKLGETSTASSNTYSYVWNDVAAGTYRITAKATDNDDSTFVSAGVIITVGSDEVKSLGLSAGKGKYLANIIPNDVRNDFNTYWNGVTAENSCKWGSVEGTRDVMNWSNADKAYNHAKAFNMSFRYHVLAWGSQYPSWITSLSPADFQEEMEEYMAAVAERYPLIDQIDVLNENMHLHTWDGNEHAEGSPYFRTGLGGEGESGYDWIIWLFEKARTYFPNAKLVINDFEIVTNSNGRNEILDIIKVLRDRGLVDGFGTQSHYFNVDGLSASNLQNALNSMATSGVPIYVTELDIKGSSNTEDSQKASYETTFPIYWNHPAVAGITLWGYVEGATWADGTGILNSDGSNRAAMTWLETYMAELGDVGYPFIVDNEVEDTLNNILTNGEFDEDTYGWKLDNYDSGNSGMTVVDDAMMSGDNALKICVSDPGTAEWHVQVSQDAPLEQGKLYEISFMAKADEACSILFTMQEGGDPYAQYIEESIELTTESEKHTFYLKPLSSDATNKLKFFLGLNETCIYLDQIIYREIDLSNVQEQKDDLQVSVYPNPVSSGKITIEQKQNRPIGNIEIFNLNGQRMYSTLAKQPSIELNLSFLQSGIYLIKMENEKSTQNERIVVL